MHIDRDEFADSIHRTWVEALVSNGNLDAAEIALNSELEIVIQNFNPDHLMISLPLHAAGRLPKESPLWQTLTNTLRGVLKNNLFDQNGNGIVSDDFPIDYRIVLLKPEDGWQDTILARLGKDRLGP